ncbi:hypothetical protein HDV03_005171 [Kappamyces sp. JEL0829]|nr:hypothetical protein HDV03_005171 [Kappamyces sp. JEL0829]
MTHFKSIKSHKNKSRKAKQPSGFPSKTLELEQALQEIIPATEMSGSPGCSQPWALAQQLSSAGTCAKRVSWNFAQNLTRHFHQKDTPQSIKRDFKKQTMPDFQPLKSILRPSIVAC